MTFLDVLGICTVGPKVEKITLVSCATNGLHSSRQTPAGRMLTISLYSVWVQDLGCPGLAIAEEAGLKVHRSTAAANSILFIPAGYVVVERGLGTEVVYGFPPC